MQPNGMQAAAAAAAEAAARRGAEAMARQAHRQELRQREEAQALQNLRAFKDSIKAAVSRVRPLPAPAPSSPPPSRHVTLPLHASHLYRALLCPVTCMCLWALPAGPPGPQASSVAHSHSGHLYPASGQDE